MIHEITKYEETRFQKNSSDTVVLYVGGTGTVVKVLTRVDFKTFYLLNHLN